MDKVTHVFNQSGVSMGNANNSKTASDKPEKPSSAASQPASGGPVASNLTKSDSSNAKNNKDSSNVEPQTVGSVISANDVKQQQLAGNNSAPSGINIPKGKFFVPLVFLFLFPLFR